MMDRISLFRAPGLLALSNGHGEDQITVRLLTALHRIRPELPIEVLPLVGEGHAFLGPARQGWLRRSSLTKRLPSGGFSNQSLSALLRDLGAGLTGLAWQQWRLTQRHGRSGGAVLAVGDLLPLAMASGSRAPFAFVGTPKSDYTWRSGPGRSRIADAYHGCKGSEWDPWEWALMRGQRCRLVAVRDRLTARGLRRRGVAALALGNPMMDGLCPPDAVATTDGMSQPSGERTIVLLAGSRVPEAIANARQLLRSLPSAAEVSRLLVLMPTGTRPSEAELTPLLLEAGFSCDDSDDVKTSVRTGTLWRRQGVRLLTGSGHFNAWVGQGEVGLATAGTATEQLVGLGIPALSIPGSGPQFTRGFAERQSKLLGGAVQCCNDVVEVRRSLLQLLADQRQRARLGAIGRQRMGSAGGSERLAELLAERLLDP